MIITHNEAFLRQVEFRHPETKEYWGIYDIQVLNESDVYRDEWRIPEHGVVNERACFRRDNPPKLLGTPTARDWKDSGPNMNYQQASKKSRLAGQIMWDCGQKAGAYEMPLALTPEYEKERIERMRSRR